LRKRHHLGEKGRRPSGKKTSLKGGKRKKGPPIVNVLKKKRKKKKRVAYIKSFKRGGPSSTSQDSQKNRAFDFRGGGQP